MKFQALSKRQRPQVSAAVLNYNDNFFFFFFFAIVEYSEAKSEKVVIKTWMLH